MSTKKYRTKDMERDFGPVTFGKILLSYRLAAEQTQDELGERLGGLSRGIICDYEKGRRIPSPEKAAEIAQNLGELESYWIQIAIQDYLREHNLNYKVKLA